MSNRLMVKIAIICLLLLGAGKTISVSAQTQPLPVTDRSALCDVPGVSRYDAWVKDLPCTPSISLNNSFNPKIEQNNKPAGVTSGFPNADDYKYLVYSSFVNNNWEIYGSQDPWSYGLQYSTRMTNNPASDIRPRLRPGTTQVLFSSNRTGNYELLLMDWGGENLKQLTLNGAYNSQPAWSADGSKIAFVSDRDGNEEIYSMQADTSGLTRLTFDSAADFDPSWSTDGTQLVWVRAVDSENGVLYVMNSDGSNPHPISGPLRFLEHVSWYGTRFAFDYDSNQDGWNDLGEMNDDGSNLKILAKGVYLLDFWAGSWAEVAPGELMFTQFQYIIHNKKLYIYSACIGVAISNIGTGCMTSSYENIYPDVAPVDFTIPNTHVVALPPYQRAGDFPVTVVGTDPGPATIYEFVLQNRLGLSGQWQDLDYFTLEYITNAESHTFNYTGQAGTTVYFRSRGRDRANNLEPWPPGDGDTTTQIYSFQLDGNVLDNRGKAIPNAGVNTSPVFSDQQNANSLGQFHRFVPTSPVNVNVNKTGYGTPPTTTLSSSSDLQYKWILPPQDNLLKNGDFEAGLDGWTEAGTDKFNQDVDLKHTGLASAGLSETTIQADVTNISNDSGISILPKTISDGDGNTHLVWVDSHNAYSGSIFYSYKPITGTWTTPISINPTHPYSSWIPEMALGKDGTLYVTWLENNSTGSIVYYAYRRADGTWSQPYDLSGSRYMWSPIEYARPEIAIDSRNTIHVIWADQDGYWYINKPNKGSWSAPFRFADGYTAHAITMDQEDTLHIVYVGQGLTDINRSVEGVWSSPVTILNDYAYQIEIAADSSNKIHLVWMYNFVGYYASRQPDGQWSDPLVISGDDIVNQIGLTVDENNAHVVWGMNDGLRYRRQYNGSVWSPIITITAPSGIQGWGWSLIADKDHIEGFWSSGPGDDTDVFTGAWDLPQRMTSSLSQSILISGDIHKPTLSFLFHNHQDGAGGLFTAQINDTLVYTHSGEVSEWMHAWVDLSPWLSQTVTLTFTANNDIVSGFLNPNIDDVSIGSWNTPVITTLDPDHQDSWVSTTITITGDNFMPDLTVRLNDINLTTVQVLDEHTIRCVSPTGFAPGFYNVWVINPGGQEAVPAGIWIGKTLFLPLTYKN